MRVAVTGAAGLLGQKVVESAVAGGSEVFPFDLIGGTETAAGPVVELDITSAGAAESGIAACGPDWIVNTAAWTAVDDSEGGDRRVREVNVVGVENLLAAASAGGSRLLTLSTDYVFDGRAGPYEEDDARNPLGVYGASKAAMEDVVTSHGGSHLIVRTMVLYGAAPGVRTNFGLWVLQNLRTGREMTVVTDQMGNPTLAADLARLLFEMMKRGAEGTWHVAGRDRVSRFDFAVALARAFGLDENLITPVRTADLGQAADRPLESGFTLRRLRNDLQLEPLGLDAGLGAFRTEVERYGDGS
jgi:dTDP-4-dehydrorhamnose reductase